MSLFRSVGFSIVRQPGEFALEIDWIKAMNTTSTFGDSDLLASDEYYDEQGNVCKLAPGQSLSDFADYKKIRWFDDKK